MLGHITTLTRDEVAAIRDLGMAVTTHTNAYIYKRGAQLLAQVGEARENEIVPLRSLLDAGVPVSLATDNVPVSLWGPIWQTVARRERQQGRRIAPGQEIDGWVEVPREAVNPGDQVAVSSLTQLVEGAPVRPTPKG